jgi:hypothetical protein
MPGIKCEHPEMVQDFIQEMGKEMTGGNNDGLGYAAFDKEGNLFGERWHNNNEAFDVRDPITEQDETVINRCLNFIWKEENYDSHGVVDLNNIASIILHTRSATSGKEFCNTHPFVRDNTALIHNGIIRNHEKFDKEVSSCDSESILTQYLKNEVFDKPEAIKDALKPLHGYFACGVLSYMNDVPVVDVFRDKQARLSAAFIKEFNTIVFTTDIDDLMKAAKSCQLTVSGPYKVDTEKMIRYHALTGDALGKYDFDGGSGTWSGYPNHGSYTGWNGNQQITSPKKDSIKRSEWNGHYFDEVAERWLPIAEFDV